MTAARRVTLDASALLAWVLDERGAATVRKLLPVAVIPASAMVETLYRAKQRGSAMSMAELHDSITAMGVQVAAIEPGDVLRAAELIHASHVRSGPSKSLSLGDGLCLAVAERLGLPLAGGDLDWAVENLSVEFIPYR